MRNVRSDDRFDGHFHDQRYEDAMFMFENGESFERAALRLGMTPDALEKLIDRHNKRKAG